MLGGSVTFSNGTQSLTVSYAAPGLPQPLVLAPGVATVTYDGSLLTFGLPEQRFAQVNYPPSQQCNYENGRGNAVRCAVSASLVGGSVTFSATVAPRPSFPCPDVQLPAGWSLVSGGLARDINTNVGPFYTYAPSEGQYEATPDARDLQESIGYWAYLDQPTSVFDLDVGNFGACIEASSFYRGPPPSPVTVGLTPGQWVMIGNPFLQATVTGADAVLTFDPPSGYQETQTLNLGQGAWCYSANGGTVTVAPTATP